MRQVYCLLILFVCAQALRGDTTLTTCTEASLRTALGQGGIIRLNCSSNVIRLTKPLVVSVNTTLITTNSAMVISGDNVTRLFVVNPGVALTISNIALFSGRHTDTNFNDGGIPDTAGAGIYNNAGTVRIFHGTVGSHTVTGTTGAAGEEGREGEDGEDGGDAAGAAIFNRGGTVFLSNVVFQANQATGGTGGVGGAGSGGLGGDGGDGGNGGAAGGAAVYSEGGLLEIHGCTFTNNQAFGAPAGEAGLGSGFMGFHGRPGVPGDAVGGAVAVDSTATLVISRSTFVANAATAASGDDAPAGVRNLEGQNGRSGGHASGGAIYSLGQLRMTNCTVTANTATGGDGGNGGTGGTSSLGADGGDGGNGGNAAGAGLDIGGGSARVVNCTFADNALTAGLPGEGGAGGGVGDDGDQGDFGLELGAALSNSGGQLNLANTILANSTPANSAGVITDLGGNLSTDTSVTFTHRRSMAFTDALLQPLASNGGRTPTMALQTNSPAINRGLMEFCPPTDQRGSNRWYQCDIGAFEFNGGIQATPTNISLIVGGRILTTNLTNAFAISWPTNSPNLRLFSATNLPSTNWLRFTNVAAITVGSSNVVRIPTTNAPRRFFKLVEDLTPFTTPPPTPGGPPTPPLPPIPGQ